MNAQQQYSGLILNLEGAIFHDSTYTDRKLHFTRNPLLSSKDESKTFAFTEPSPSLLIELSGTDTNSGIRYYNFYVDAVLSG